MTLSYSRADPLTSRQHPWVRRGLLALRVVAVMFLVLVTVAAVVGLSTLVGGPAVTVYVGLCVLMLLSGAAFAKRGLARRRVASVLTYVARGARAGIPLPEFLAAAAEAERGVLRRRLKSVAGRIATGAPLAVALSDSLPELDLRQARLLASSESAGATVDVADRLAREHARSGVDATRQPVTQGAYWATLMLAIAGLGWMLTIFVIPKFWHIFRDFGQPRPWLTTALFDERFFLPLSIALAVSGALGILLLLIAPLAELITRRGSARSQSRVWAFVPWLGASRRHRRLADLYFAVAHAVEAGVSLERTLASVPGLDGRRLGAATVFAHALSEGKPFADAARAARLPPGDATMLGLAADTAHLGRACRFLADHHDRESERTRRFLSAVLSVGMIFVAGAVVLLLVLSMWVPMLTLIETVLKTALHVRR